MTSEMKDNRSKEKVTETLYISKVMSKTASLLTLRIFHFYENEEQ
jgi:hypothetical protein